MTTVSEPTAREYALAERLLHSRTRVLDADAAVLRCWIADTKPAPTVRQFYIVTEDRASQQLSRVATRAALVAEAQRLAADRPPAWRRDEIQIAALIAVLLAAAVLFFAVIA